MHTENQNIITILGFSFDKHDCDTEKDYSSLCFYLACNSSLLFGVHDWNHATLISLSGALALHWLESVYPIINTPGHILHLQSSPMMMGQSKERGWEAESTLKELWDCIEAALMWGRLTGQSLQKHQSTYHSRPSPERRKKAERCEGIKPPTFPLQQQLPRRAPLGSTS